MPRVGQISKGTALLSHHSEQSVHAGDTSPAARGSHHCSVCTRGTQELKSDSLKHNSNKCIGEFKDLALILLLEAPPCWMPEQQLHCRPDQSKKGFALSLKLCAKIHTPALLGTQTFTGGQLVYTAAPWAQVLQHWHFLSTSWSILKLTHTCVTTCLQSFNSTFLNYYSTVN